MWAGTIQSHDLRRIAALDSYNILDTAEEETFDRFTRLVAASLDTPIAAISLVDADRQWFKSVVGLGVRETPRNIAFCNHTIMGCEPFIVEDTWLDRRFASNPLVTDDPRIRFYAGAPLTTPDGFNLGSLCAIDTRPRKIKAAQQAKLVDLAATLMTTLDLIKEVGAMRRLALTDALTDLPNRIQFFKALTNAIASMGRTKQPLSLLYIDCDDFKRLNDVKGHQAGDDTLRALASDLLALVRASDVPARLGGDEFAIVLPATGPRAAKGLAQRILRTLGRSTEGRETGTPLSIGVVTFLTPPASAPLALAQVDAAMYEAKGSGKNRIATVVAGGVRGAIGTVHAANEARCG